MTTYKNIKGKRIKRFATDLDNDQAEGQIFYSNTDNEFKTVVSSAAWSSSAPTLIPGAAGFGFGTQTAGVVGVGEVGPPGFAPATTQHYNG